MTLTAPQYSPVANYCRNGSSIGFTVVGSGTAGNLHLATQSLESHLGTSIEVLSRGLPNNLDDAYSTLQSVTGCPQHIIWAGPLTKMDGSVSLTSMVGGALDSQLASLAGYFVSLRSGGVNDTIRMGWEYDFSNYPWGIGVSGNTYSLIAQAMDRYIVKMRAGGYNGRFNLCAGFVGTGSDPTKVLSLMAQASQIDELGLDNYNNIPNTSYGKGEWERLWTSFTEPNLNIWCEYARTQGMQVSYPEAGVLIVNNVYHTNDTGTFWTYNHAHAKANADVVTAICIYNQNGYSGSTVIEDDALFYSGSPSGSGPTSITSLGNLTNTSATGPWYDTPSMYHTLSLPDYKTNMIAGSMQYTPTVSITPPVATAKSINSKRRGTQHLRG